MISSLRRYKSNFPSIGSNTYIDTSSVLIGEITIGQDSSVWPLVVARGDVNSISIGDRTNIQDGSVLHVTHKNTENPKGAPLVIGNDVTIGHKVMLHGCVIEDRVLVGMGSIILDNAYIEADVMIGAGSLVPPNKRLESGYLYIGSPVKQVRPLSIEEIASLKKSALNYVNFKNDYIEEEIN
ncbi:gamma carbonic anhydrase family protein [Aliivibrio fischeri]|nr:gamma carbonic anhydrase family protein [Aliivibrio fischeri]MUK38163.1 gamma carbonic anhydrase family protein [Aliivibrio fischeri]MUL07264.1 gamma carbonic anhydrase family protein [Aliivibrio fischeri]